MGNKEIKAALEAFRVTLRLQRIPNRFRLTPFPSNLFYIRVRNLHDNTKDDASHTIIRQS